jgi:hypothetical protein
MLAGGYSFKVGKGSGIVVTRDEVGDLDVKSRIGKFLERVYARSSDEFADDVAQSIVFCSRYLNPSPKSSRLSEVWDQSLEGNLIPYNVKARKGVLKLNAPIRAFRK